MQHVTPTTLSNDATPLAQVNPTPGRLRRRGKGHRRRMAKAAATPVPAVDVSLLVQQLEIDWTEAQQAFTQTGCATVFGRVVIGIRVLAKAAGLGALTLTSWLDQTGQEWLAAQLPEVTLDFAPAARPEGRPRVYSREQLARMGWTGEVTPAVTEPVVLERFLPPLRPVLSAADEARLAHAVRDALAPA